MNVSGMGVVTARGRGLAALEGALESGWVAPAGVEVKGLPSGRLPVYAVPAEALNDKTVLAKARRADRFTRMSVLAAGRHRGHGPGPARHHVRLPRRPA